MVGDVHQLVVVLEGLLGDGDVASDGLLVCHGVLVGVEHAALGRGVAGGHAAPRVRGAGLGAALLVADGTGCRGLEEGVREGLERGLGLGRELELDLGGGADGDDGRVVARADLSGVLEADLHAVELVAGAEDALGEGSVLRLGLGRVANRVLHVDDVLERDVELLDVALNDEGLVLVAGVGGDALLLRESVALLPELLGSDDCHFYSFVW